MSFGPTTIDLFAGAGGLSLGIAAAGFFPEAVYEIDGNCCRTLELNLIGQTNSHKTTQVIEGDLSVQDLLHFRGKIDLLTGGPPCQPFSFAGKHNANADKRDLFPTAIRAVMQIQPKAFIFENVAGLLRPQFQNYFEYIRLQLTHPDIFLRSNESWQSHLRRLEDHHSSGSKFGLNYRLIVHPVNAADYGVPQMRQRVFLVGFREDLGIHWHFPHPTHSREALIRDMLSGSYWDRVKLSKKRRKIPDSLSAISEFDLEDLLPWKTTREAISDLPNPANQNQVMSSQVTHHEFKNGARVYAGHTGSKLDLPAKTIKAGVHGVPGGENMFEDDSGNLRYFTVRECSRIQTFPDDVNFFGPWSSVVRQLGNAVPYSLAKQLGHNIHEALGCKT
jgi:DNA (cytosine-5)-methyltransferase 1